MTQRLYIHPDNPQKRLIKQACDVVLNGGIIVYPTDSGYAFGCHIGDKKAMDKIRQWRQLSAEHNFTLVCRDLSDIALYAKMDNSVFRIIKAHTPGAYTFILPATKEVPRRLQHAKRKTIGLRIPDNPVALALLTEMGEPIMSSTLIAPNETSPMTDQDAIYDWLKKKVDLMIDAGYGDEQPTTVIEFIDNHPQVMRQGLGDSQPFE